MSRSQRPSSLGDYVAHEARHAIHDIRQKLFEEAWFGRVVTAAPVMEVIRDHEPGRSFDELWGRSPRGEERPDHSPERDEPEIER
jgi:hypothetical protein